MNHIKLIKSEQDHEQALARLMALMDMEPESDSIESDEIDVLAMLIEKYEEEEFPIDSPNPIEAIKFRMDQQGLTNKDLVTYIGSAPKVSEVLSGKRNLSLNMIRKLSTGLGISADVLIRSSEQKNACESDVDWSAFPLSEMRKRGYFEGFNGSLNDLKEYAAENITVFLSSVRSGFNLQPALLRSTAHFRSNDKEIDSYAMWAWQVRVLQKASENKLTTNYEKGTVNLEWMSKLARLSWSAQGVTLAKEFLNKHGIHLIVEPHLPKTYLDGAVCISPDGNPVVALTLRHDRLDSFWFSLMHELAHITLHFDETETWYLDDLDVMGGGKIEQEADALASEALIPSEHWENQGMFDANKVRALSAMLEVSPCIIAGRLRHESSKHSMFGTLFREKVRQHF
ncbi:MULTISPECIES: ImmA/IrrE family metallo-endopeptidase [Vibrio]|uniref:ImmA/IrrE family metallo-endopeptidase n=1 Tax=Vibrio TaxID=662 RepID=UPI0002ECBEC2|nr:MULTISPECIES: ImmA/IrrE family metallo-endopeptidase [Vibrio]OEF40411.1 plasmid stabilization protein [Vibrio cyclitrophicus 1F273]PMI75333.1 plasmid stabilization protein [Vibrio splendidus]